MLTKQVMMVWATGMCWAPIALAQERGYVAHGPAESVKLEEALYRFLPGYEDGIAPRPKILERGMRKEEIPTAYVSKLELWIDRVLRPALKARSREDVVMVGVPKLRYDRDYIVGRVACESCDAPDRARAVEFQADDRGLSLTLHSQSLKVPRSGPWSREEIVAIIAHFLNIPEGKIPRITVEHRAAEVDGIRLYYGKLHCEWTQGQSSDRERRWWSYIPFWATDGTLFVHISTIDWEHGETPPARVNAGLDLSGSVREDTD